MSSDLTRASVNLATPGDVPLLAEMRRREGWAANEWLLELLTAWSRARVLVIRDRAEEAGPAASGAVLRGTTVATAYGALGFIGNVIVDPAVRGRGYGRLLMAAALDWLQAEGARTVLLDATETGRPLYERFGFVGTVHSRAVWQPLRELNLGALASATAVRAMPLGVEEIGDVAALDREAFGADRMGLLSALPVKAGARGYVVRGADGAVEGYVFVRPLPAPARGIYVGPFVARSPETARALFVAALFGERALIGATEPAQCHLSLGLPGTNSEAVAFYRSLGVNVATDDLRMQLDLTESGPVPVPAERGRPGAVGRPEWLYGMLSTMVG